MLESMERELLEFVRTEPNAALDFIRKAKNFQGDIYLYGAGSCLPFAAALMRKYGTPVKAILDSCKSGVFPGDGGSHDEDIPIISWERFLSERDPLRSCWFVISAPSAEQAIREKLSGHFPSECIFSFEMELYASNYMPNVDAYRKYLIEHWKELIQLHDALFDERSRMTLWSVIKGRLTGRLSYFRECYVSDQYYPPDIVRFSKDECLAELGSYDGQTLLEFIRRCPDYRTAYCFEPDRELLPTLEDIRRKQAEHGKNVHIIPKGAWSGSAVLKFSQKGTALGTARILNEQEKEQGYSIETVAVDEVIHEPVSYMKMDIEGSEFEALRGAAGQISEHRPKLAVCVYHRVEDLLNIWNYLRKLVPAYRFYLRHHMFTGTETVLYAIPGNQNDGKIGYEL